MEMPNSTETNFTFYFIELKKVFKFRYFEEYSIQPNSSFNV